MKRRTPQLETVPLRHRMAENATLCLDEVESQERRALLLLAVDGLPPNYAFVIRRRFGLDGPEATLSEVARELRLTPERIRIIQLHALRKLWHRTLDLRCRKQT